MSEQDPSKTVTNEIEQQLSAFVDGELDAAEAEFLSRRLSADESLRGRLKQYYLIGNVARGEHPVPATFAPAVHERLDDSDIEIRLDDDAVSASSAAGGWQRWLGGAGIAAAVCTLALVTLNQSVEQRNDPAPTASRAGVVPEGSTYTVPALPDDGLLQPQITLREPRLVNYMLRHGQVNPLIIPTDLNADETDADAPATADEEQP